MVSRYDSQVHAQCQEYPWPYLNDVGTKNALWLFAPQELPSFFAVRDPVIVTAICNARQLLYIFISSELNHLG